MLANTLTWLGLTLLLYHILNQTLWVRYFTEMVLVSLGNATVNKSSHYLLYILLGLLRDNYENEKVKKVDTMC